jgi:hypothetical protein
VSVCECVCLPVDDGVYFGLDRAAVREHADELCVCVCIFIYVYACIYIYICTCAYVVRHVYTGRHI